MSYGRQFTQCIVGLLCWAAVAATSASANCDMSAFARRVNEVLERQSATHLFRIKGDERSWILVGRGSFSRFTDMGGQDYFVPSHMIQEISEPSLGRVSVSMGYEGARKKKYKAHIPGRGPVLGSPGYRYDNVVLVGPPGIKPDYSTRTHRAVPIEQLEEVPQHFSTLSEAAGAFGIAEQLDNGVPIKALSPDRLKTLRENARKAAISLVDTDWTDPTFARKLKVLRAKVHSDKFPNVSPDDPARITADREFRMLDTLIEWGEIWAKE